MKLIRHAAVAAVAAAAAVALPTLAQDPPTDFGCTAGSGSQGAERHCGGYFQADTPDPVTGEKPQLLWQVYLPDPAVWGPGPYPTVVDYSGYEPATTFFDGLKGAFISQGYAVAGVNVRGTGCSGGRFDYFEQAEWADGAQAIDFLGEQPWSDGNVAMVGKSYPGITQAFVAAEQPEHLRAIVPGAFFADIYRDVAYPGGILNAVFASLWSLGSRPANEIDQWTGGVQEGDQTCIQSQAEHAANAPTNPFVELTAHPYDDQLWQDRSPDFFADRIQVPVMTELAWQDEELAARGIDLLDRLPNTTPWRAVVTNGDHGEYYDGWVLNRIYRFLDFYLKKQVPPGDPCATTTYVPHGNGKGKGSGDAPVTRPTTYDEALACYQAEPRVDDGFENGPTRTPSWVQQFPTWPVTDQVQRLYLHSGGTLDDQAPTTAEPATTYTYTPVLGTNAYRNMNDLPLISDVDPTGQSDHEWWQDKPPAGTTAAFTTAPLPRDEMLVGTGSLDLYLSSTAPDTDVEVMVSELRKNDAGAWQEEYVAKGWLRASHRALDESESTPLRPYQTHQLTDVQPLVPGRPTPMRVEIFPFGHVFRAGTRLRITVEAPNAQPELWGFAGLPNPAVNSIASDPNHPSSLALPLVSLPAGTVFPPERPCGDLRNQPCRPAT